MRGSPKIFKHKHLLRTYDIIKRTKEMNMMQAFKLLREEMKSIDKIKDQGMYLLICSLLMNLDKSSKDEAKFNIEME